MKKIATVLLFLFLATSAYAEGLDVFLNNLRVEASADQYGFGLSLSSHFGIPQTRVNLVLGSVHSPDDAFMILQLSRYCGWPVERIIPVYERNRGRGWGVIAQELGIKPGSREFKALKNGEFGYSYKRNKGKGEDEYSGSGKGHGNGHDKNKGKKDKW